MASNYGNLEYGHFVSSGKYAGQWAWDKGAPSWTTGFLHTYPITMFLGVIISFLTVAYFWKRMKYSWDVLYILVIIIVPTSIIGARLWFLISESGAHPEYWKQWYVLSGLSIQGGVMASGTSACIFVWTKRHLVDFRTVVGMILPAVIIGQAIGRWGNFDNHEVFGAVVKNPDSLNWLTFIKPHMLITVNGVSEYRQPFFFYESMLNLLGYLTLVWLLQRKNWVKPGVPAALYLMYYGITRIIMEPLRDPSDIMGVNGFQVSTFISALWIVAGFILLVWWQGLTRPFDKWAEKSVIPLSLAFINAIYFVTKTTSKSVKFALFKTLSKIFKSKSNQYETIAKWKKTNKLTKDFFKKEYEAIYPVKPRKIFFFGETVEYKKQVFMYFGKEVPNKVKLYIPVVKQDKWSKKEINQGYKNKKVAK